MAALSSFLGVFLLATCYVMLADCMSGDLGGSCQRAAFKKYQHALKHCHFTCSPVKKGADCDKRNPCNAKNRALGRYYFEYYYSNKYFVQCGPTDTMCSVMPCGPGTAWSQKDLVCVWPNDIPGGIDHKPTAPPLYDCYDHNPCNAENRKQNRYLFASVECKTRYVQCGLDDSQCFVRDCPRGTSFNPDIRRCHH